MLQYARLAIDAHRQDTSIIYPDFKGGEYVFGVEVSSYGMLKKVTAVRPFTVRMPLTNKETRLEAFNWVCEHCLEIAARDKKKVLLLVDEAQRVTTKNKNADGLELIQENGGMLGVDLIFTTHRPSDVNGSLRAACDRVVVFQTHHSADIRVFQENIDVPDSAFKALKQEEYLEWHVQEGYRIVRKGEEGPWVAPYVEDSST